jgi:hypothetical protein
MLLISKNALHFTEINRRSEKKKFVIVYFDIRAIFDIYTCTYEEETDNDQ